MVIGNLSRTDGCGFRKSHRSEILVSDGSPGNTSKRYGFTNAGFKMVRNGIRP